jgi:hypothetical protein
VTGIWVFWDFSQARGPGLFIGAAIAAMMGGLVLVRLVRVFREPVPRRGEQKKDRFPPRSPRVEIRIAIDHRLRPRVYSKRASNAHLSRFRWEG